MEFPDILMHMTKTNQSEAVNFVTSTLMTSCLQNVSLHEQMDLFNPWHWFREMYGDRKIISPKSYCQKVGQ